MGANANKQGEIKLVFKVSIEGLKEHIQYLKRTPSPYEVYM